MQKRVLFITNRNILTTCGELRLIKNRAEALYSQYGIPTDFIAISKLNRINASNKEKILAGGTITEVLQDPRKPWSLITADWTLRRLIKKIVCNYSAVVFSGSGMPLYAKCAREGNQEALLYADVHGASEDIIELVKQANAIKKIEKHLIYQMDRRGLRGSTTYLDGYFAVTPALAEYIKKNFEPKENANFVIAPCATGAIEESYLDDYVDYRSSFRKKFGIKSGEKVFIYSGGVSSWQCIDETIQLYRAIKNKTPNTRMLIFSHSIDFVQKLIKDDDIQVYSFTPDELKKALCAGDFAFLLRKDCITNNVAFPNKFLEYVLSGMNIITTPYVFEIANQVKMNNIGMLYEMNEDITPLLEYVSTARREDAEWKRRMDVLKYNSFKLRLKPFVEALNGGKR